MPRPQLLRVEHPAAKYTKVHGGVVETDADPSKLKFFDRERGGWGVGGRVWAQGGGRRERRRLLAHTLVLH